MAKKTKKNFKFPSNKRVLLALIVVFIALAGATYFIKERYIDRYEEASEITSTMSIRELVLTAAKGTKTPAPVDHQTGDVYFPQAKLYLPAPSTPIEFTYMYIPENKELSVSATSILNQASVPLYTARDVHQVFAAVPKLQACQRGVRVVFDKVTNQDEPIELKHTAKLKNGKSVFIYMEKSCPELEETAGLLAKLQSY